jgi:hypothetical protein
MRSSIGRALVSKTSDEGSSPYVCAKIITMLLYFLGYFLIGFVIAVLSRIGAATPTCGGDILIILLWPLYLIYLLL